VEYETKIKYAEYELEKFYTQNELTRMKESKDILAVLETEQDWGDGMTVHPNFWS